MKRGEGNSVNEGFGKDFCRKGDISKEGPGHLVNHRTLKIEKSLSAFPFPKVSSYLKSFHLKHDCYLMVIFVMAAARGVWQHLFKMFVAGGGHVSSRERDPPLGRHSGFLSLKLKKCPPRNQVFCQDQSAPKEQRRRHSEEASSKMEFLESRVCPLPLEGCSQTVENHLNAFKLVETFGIHVYVFGQPLLRMTASPAAKLEIKLWQSMTKIAEKRSRHLSATFCSFFSCMSGLGFKKRFPNLSRKPTKKECFSKFMFELTIPTYFHKTKVFEVLRAGVLKQVPLQLAAMSNCSLLNKYQGHKTKDFGDRSGLPDFLGIALFEGLCSGAQRNLGQ